MLRLHSCLALQTDSVTTVEIQLPSLSEIAYFAPKMPRRGSRVVRMDPLRFLAVLAILYKATKPGLALSVVYLSVFYVLLIIRAPFYVLLVFVAMCSVFWLF